MNKQIFNTLAGRQSQGVMFHSEMVDYYTFLNLKELSCLHYYRFNEENESFRKIKKYFIETYHRTLRLSDSIPIPKVVPEEWDNKTSMDVDKESLKTLIKKSLNYYMAWEKETLEIYTKCANQLFEEEEYDDYSFTRTLVDDVKIELSHIESLLIDFQAVDYDINLIKGLSYKLHW